MLDRSFRETLDRLGVARQRVLLAVSGGRDSMVLLDLMTRVAPERALALGLAHVHHGLRGADADADEAFVAQAAERAGLPLVVRRVEPEALRRGRSSRERPTLEEAARTLRRAALDEIAAAEGYDWIATAHHAGDQAETLLLRILRGTGPDGLAGMAERAESDRRIRPLLRVAPETLADWARTRALAWREDESNWDRRFARNRLRLDVLPALSPAFNPQLLRTLGDLAEAARTDLEWIEGLVDVAAEERLELGPAHARFALDGWAELPEALARRLVRRALRAVGLGRDLSRAHLERCLEFLRRGRAAGRPLRLELPRGFVLRRVDDAFVLAMEKGPDGIHPPGDATVHGRD
ncbi:MAG: tRNA lysidine(34) synthetase TilS [Myxococcota bacterium]